MSKIQKNANTEKTAESRGFSCMEMMANMMGQSGEELNCESIISHFMSEEEIPEDWIQEMSRMAGSMSSCCGAQAESVNEGTA